MVNTHPKTHHKYPVIFEWPNAPLSIAIVGWFIHRFSSGWLESVSLVIYLASLTIWSVLELAQGASWLRRLLGGVVLTMTIIHIARLIWA